MSPVRKLGEMRKGESGRIVSVDSTGVREETGRRLLEMGLLEGSFVEVLYEAPFGGDPLAVRVRGAMIAIRRSEANCIEVAV